MIVCDIIDVIGTGFSASLHEFAEHIYLDASTGSVDLTLPPASLVPEGILRFYAEDATNGVTLSGDGADTIDGSPSYSDFFTGMFLFLQSDGTGWRILASSQGAANFYTTDGTLSGNRTVVGDDNTLGFTMGAGQFWPTFTTGSFIISVDQGSDDVDFSVSRASGIRGTYDNGTFDTVFAQQANQITMSSDNSAAGLTVSIQHDPSQWRATATDGSETSELSCNFLDAKVSGTRYAIIDGILQFEYLEISSNKTIDESDDASIIYANDSGGSFTITLSASPAAGDSYFIFKGSSSVNSVTIAGNGNNIRGASDYVLSSSYQSIMLTFNGSFWMALVDGSDNSADVREMTANGTIDVGDLYVYGNSSGGNITLTMDTSPSTGQRHTITKGGDSNTVTLSTDISRPILGSASFVLSAPYSSVTLVYSGAFWMIV